MKKIFQPGMFKQIMSMVASNAVGIFLCSVLYFICMFWSADKPFWAAVMSGILTLIYFSEIYQKAWACAERDNKSYTETTPYLFKGTVLSIGILVYYLIIWLLYIFTWNALTIDGSIATWTGLIYNVIYVLSTIMYTGFSTPASGNVAWFVQLLIYIVPVIASTLGYIAGEKGFMLTEKLIPFIYEKKKAEQKK